MTPDDLYQSWKNDRARPDIPAGFTERVMAAVHAHEPGKQPTRWLHRWLLVLIASRPGKIGVCVLAALVCAFRMASVAALFMAR